MVARADAPAVTAVSSRQQAFDTFADELAAQWMRANPAAATVPLAVLKQVVDADIAATLHESGGAP
jgi:hypothetical protein